MTEKWVKGLTDSRNVSEKRTDQWFQHLYAKPQVTCYFASLLSKPSHLPCSVHFPTFDSVVRTTILIWMMMRDIIIGILQGGGYLRTFAYKIVRVLSKSGVTLWGPETTNIVRSLNSYRDWHTCRISKGPKQMRLAFIKTKQNKKRMITSPFWKGLSNIVQKD